MEQNKLMLSNKTLNLQYQKMYFKIRKKLVYKMEL